MIFMTDCMNSVSGNKGSSHTFISLFVPNIIWTKNKPSGYEESAKKENKVLLIFERVGQALVTVLVFYLKLFRQTRDSQ